MKITVKVAPKLTAKRVRELLHYNPDTGVFTWRVSPSRSVKVGTVAGNLHKSGYVLIKIDERAYVASRLVWLYQMGSWPSNEIDHRNLKKSDNRWDNLRPATGSQNKRNTGVQRNNKFGLKGVCFHSQRGKFQAQITSSGRTRHLGLFDTAEEAHAAYCEAAEKYHGDFARVA